MSRLIPAALLIFVFAVLLSVALPAREARAAPALVGLSQACVSGKVSASFSWQGADASAKEQWLDLSTSDNGWQPGTFLGAGPMSASSTSYTWLGLLAGTAHVARINQKLSDDTWQSSATFPFSTLACTPGSPDTLVVGNNATPTPSPTATTPTVTPSPQPSPTPVPAYFQVIGFATKVTNGGPPPDMVPVGGTVQACGAFSVYGFIRYTNVRERTELIQSWLIGQSAIPRANIIISPGSGITYGEFAIQDTTKASYTLQLQIDKDKPPVASGDFTLQC